MCRVIAWPMVLVSISGMLAGGCARESESSATARSVGADPAAPAGGSTVLLRVEGMHCDACVNAITHKLQKMDGVQNVQVSLKNREARVVVAEGRHPGQTELIEAIDALGYKASPLEEPATRPAEGESQG
jgi:copper chaperone CopZ